MFKFLFKKFITEEQIKSLKFDRSFSYLEAQYDFKFKPISFSKGLNLQIKNYFKKI